MVKFLLIILGAYLVYRYVLRPSKALPRAPSEEVPISDGRSTQEPDLFIDHEEIKKEHGQNK